MRRYLRFLRPHGLSEQTAGSGKRSSRKYGKRSPPGTDVAGYVRRTSALWLSAYILQEYSRKGKREREKR